MPLKGVEKVRGRYQALIKEISGPRTLKVVNAIVATGAAYAKLYTPVDTSALINSQRKQVSKGGSGVVVGRVWYSQEYAIWLETRDHWTPRKKPTAKPHFLKSGFEDPEPQADIKDIIMQWYKL